MGSAVDVATVRPCLRLLAEKCNRALGAVSLLASEFRKSSTFVGRQRRCWASCSAWLGAPHRKRAKGEFATRPVCDALLAPFAPFAPLRTSKITL